MPVTHAKAINTTKNPDWTQAQLDAAIAAGQFAAGTTLADIALNSDFNADHIVTGLTTTAFASAAVSQWTNDAGYISSTSGDWTGTFDGQEGSYYLNRANHTGTQAATTIANGSVSDTEFQYLDGVTSAIQTQLNGKQASGSYVLQTTTVNGHVLSSNVTVTASDVGLGSVTNDAQTKAAIVPNTVPTTGQILAGNAGGTAYAPVSMSGDAALASTGAITLATVNANTGSFGSSTAIPNFTVNGKGLLTAAGTSVVIAPASTLSGTTLASGVTASSLTSLGSQAQALNMNSHQINNVTDPSLAQDAATKNYVDNATAGLNSHASCRVATTANLVGVYNNGASGVGATFTYTSVGVDAIDGVTLALNDRILVKNQVTQFQNGIYTITTLGTAIIAGILTRATDFDQPSEVSEGAYTVIEEGTANAGTLWLETGQGPFTIGTTAIVFTELQVGSQTVTLTGAITGTGAGSIATSLGSFTSAQLLAALTDETGTGAAVFATSPTLVTPLLGTPTSGTLTNCSGLPVSTGISGLGTNVATFLATPTSANLAAALTDETGTGANVFADSPTLTTQATISGTAPLLAFTDTTASAKSLTIKVDANIADFRESAGAGGSFISLDLANTRFGFRTNAPDYDVKIIGSNTAGSGINVRTTAFTNVPNPGTVSEANAILNARGFGFTFDSQVITSGLDPTAGIGVAVSRANPCISLRNAGGPTLLTEIGNLKIGGSIATRATTEGTNHIDIFNGTAPVGTLTNGTSLYSAAGELRVMDAAGNSTLLSPHDEENKHLYYSKDTSTGDVLVIETEALLDLLDAIVGGGYVHRYNEGKNTPQLPRDKIKRVNPKIDPEQVKKYFRSIQNQS